jgi:hypothetical protein
VEPVVKITAVTGLPYNKNGFQPSPLVALDEIAAIDGQPRKPLAEIRVHPVSEDWSARSLYCIMFKTHNRVKILFDD